MIADAESILKVCGLGSYLHVGCGNDTLVFELLKRTADAYGLDRSQKVIEENQMKAPGRFFQGELAQYPFDAESFDHIIIGDVLLEYNTEQLSMLISAIRLMARKSIVLRFSPSAYQRMRGNRILWNDVFLRSGLRKHAGAINHTMTQGFNSADLDRISFYARVPEQALDHYPQALIQTHERPYVDQLRNPDSISDSILSRYSMLKSKCRPGDVIVDLGCKAGYGAAIIAENGQAKQVIGIDSDADIIAYAKENYTLPHLSFQVAELANLTMFSDHSVDTIFAMDVLDQVDDLSVLLAEIKRVLKPDGRFLGNFPCVWKDGSGLTLRTKTKAYQWRDIKQLLSLFDFIIEERFAESAASNYQRMPVNAADHLQPDWWIFSSFIDPRKVDNIPYANPYQLASMPKHIDFAEYYDNPWLYRVMVQLGQRITDKDILAAFCIDVANSARKGSADQGAALCVIAYQMLESGDVTVTSLMHLIEIINQFDEAIDKNNPHAYRWSISLHYVGARLLLTVGSREEALQAFKACADMDVLNVTPLLATKTISAHMYIGLLLSGHDIEQSKEHFKLAIKEAHRVLQNDWKDILGDLDQPLSFGLPETAELVEIAGQCAAALHALNSNAELPGVLWEKVNIKRFGLVEWNHSLERENKILLNHAVNA